MTRPARCAWGEQGFAMITVMLVIMIITLLISGSLAYSLGSLSISRHDQDWNAALSAAEAGLDDYLFRLNQNTNYWQYSATTPPPDSNKAFSFTTGASPQPVFVQVPGLASDAKFHYRVDISTLPTDGAIKIYSTGAVRNTTRTVQVVVRQKSFLDFLYYTDFETVDPNLYNNPPDNINSTQAATECAPYYAYPAQVGPPPLAANPGRTANCRDISFASGDVINGPLATNDAIHIFGTPTFAGTVTSSWPGTPVAPLPPANCAQTRIWVDTGSGNPTFSSCPVSAAPMKLPPSTPGLKGLTDPIIAGSVGCLFTGPTNIVLKGDGTMDVTSPDTQVSKCPAAPTPTPWPRLTAAQKATPVNMPLPPNGVVYIQNAPTAPVLPATDPNYTAAAINCTTTATTHPLGYPLPAAAGDVTPYGCSDGDLFVSGVLNGQLTIATDNNVNIINNITYQNGLIGAAATDVLGLIAHNYIQVYHPVDSSGTELSGTLLNPVIDAAMVALTHSFIVPNGSSGDPANTGKLTINGAFAQEYRGQVGQGFCCSGSPPVVTIVHGYLKNYFYDPRLKYRSPPHFIDPVASAWGIKIWSETNPAAYAPPSCSTVPASCP